MQWRQRLRDVTLFGRLCRRRLRWRFNKAEQRVVSGPIRWALADISHRKNDDRKAIQMLERALDNNKEFAAAKELMAKLKT